MDKLSRKYQVRACGINRKVPRVKNSEHYVIPRAYLFFSLYIFSGCISAWSYKDKIARFTKPAVAIYTQIFWCLCKCVKNSFTSANILAPIFVQISSKVSRPIWIYLGSINAARWRYFRNSVSADNIWYNWPTVFFCDHDLITIQCTVHPARSFEKETFLKFFFLHISLREYC